MKKIRNILKRDIKLIPMKVIPDKRAALESKRVKKYIHSIKYGLPKK